MSTRSEAILAALLSMLTAAGLSDVYRSRQTAFAREEGVVTAIEPVRDDPEYLVSMSGPVMGMLTLHIVTIARGEVPDQVAAPRLAAIEAALHADRTLTGLCGMLWLKGTDWDFDDAYMIYNREGVVVEMSDSDGDNFQKNLITLRAERRLALAEAKLHLRVDADITRRVASHHLPLG